MGRSGAYFSGSSYSCYESPGGRPRLGGAGNVVMNLATLGTEVSVCGVTGKDETGEIINKLLAENEVDRSGVIVSENYKSCLKHRMIAGQTHLLRMDIDPDPDTDFPQNQLIKYLQEKVPNCDAAIVSTMERDC
ncbi:MAG: hypothetical protein Ct9H300mP28_28400 [Pseudomonadota bacterium]|nr:MAG: hypothetical protein Ct9H300mP28_28400 [Pseudomonadota bacterium]